MRELFHVAKKSWLTLLMLVSAKIKVQKIYFYDDTKSYHAELRYVIWSEKVKTEDYLKLKGLKV